MKPLLPSLREKKRYVVFEIIGSNFHKKKAEKDIISNILGFIGELGFSRANIRLIDDCWVKNKGIIRVNVKYLNEFKMALGLIKKLNNKKIIINVIGVSGILKKAKSKFMEG